MASQNFRRTWDPKKYQNEALERLQDKKQEAKTTPVDVTKEVLERNEVLRSKKVEIGRISFSRAGSNGSNFYCDICKVQNTDSISYISHLNSKNHNKTLGKQINVVEKSSLSQVRDRFELLKRKKTAKLPLPHEKLAKKPKIVKDEERKPATPRITAALDTETETMKSILGFSEFGSGKK
jgi:hypothetical protein